MHACLRVGVVSSSSLIGGCLLSYISQTRGGCSSFGGFRFALALKLGLVGPRTTTNTDLINNSNALLDRLARGCASASELPRRQEGRAKKNDGRAENRSIPFGDHHRRPSLHRLPCTTRTTGPRTRTPSRSAHVRERGGKRPPMQPPSSASGDTRSRWHTSTSLVTLKPTRSSDACTNQCTHRAAHRR